MGKVARKTSRMPLKVYAEYQPLGSLRGDANCTDILICVDWAAFELFVINDDCCVWRVVGGEGPPAVGDARDAAVKGVWFLDDEDTT